MQNSTIENIRRNKNKLKVNELYSYKQLTKILNIDYLKSQNSKISQLKEVNTVIELEKVKTKYKIKGIRKQETQIIKNKKSATYSDDVLLSALYFLLKDTKKEDKEIVKCINRDTLACEIGLKHKNNSIVAKYQPQNFCEQLDVDMLTFKYVYPRVMNVVSYAISYLLKRLQKENLATIFNRYQVVTTNNINRIATDEEYAKIESIKRKILNEMQIKNESLLYNKYNNLVIEFYTKVDLETIKQLGIRNSYKFLEIHIDIENVKEYLRIFKHMTLNEALEITNKKFLDKQLKNCKNNKNRRLNSTKAIPVALILDEFDSNSAEIIESLININADELVFDTKTEFKPIENQ